MLSDTANGLQKRSCVKLSSIRGAWNNNFTVDLSSFAELYLRNTGISCLKEKSDVCLIMENVVFIMRKNT
jgi:hypothetical protein